MSNDSTNLSLTPSILYAREPSKSLLDDLLAVGSSHQKTPQFLKIKANATTYNSNTESFIQEYSNVSRRLSILSQNSEIMESSQASKINTNLPPSWQNNDFVTVSRKTKRGPEVSERRVRQKADTSSSNFITKNRFDPLLTVTETGNMTEETIKPKVQPIFVTNVVNFKDFQLDLNANGFDKKYLIKVLNNQIKIIPEDVTIYKDMIKMFQIKKVNYYTHRLKQERSFRVVLRNVHSSTPSEDIIQDLKELGYDVENVSNIKHRQTKDPLPMFFIDLKNNPNNKSIYSITKLGNKIVKFEPPNPKREIPQCKRCQRFGHTQNNCGRAFRCVKCTGNHLTNACPKTTRDEPAKCVNCGENHPANYKGCQVYKKLLEKRYPALRKRHIETPIPTPRATTPNLTRENFSYAQAVKNDSQNIQRPSVEAHSSNHNEQNLVVFMKESFSELKEMFRDLMKQNSVMINLLTALISKMK